MLLLQHQQRLVGSLERAGLCDRLRPLSDDSGRALSQNTAHRNGIWYENQVWKWNGFFSGLLLCLGFHGCQNVRLNSNLTVKNVLCFGETQLEIISVAIPLAATRCHCSTVDPILLMRARPNF